MAALQKGSGTQLASSPRRGNFIGILVQLIVFLEFLQSRASAIPARLLMHANSYNGRSSAMRGDGSYNISWH